jgi:peptide-methionine (S)-S-oxide reductase
MENKTEKAIFAAGCFWGVEAKFRVINGVVDAFSGYSGGTKENPTYEEVCSGLTGHAESVQVIFDPSIVSYKDLLKVFWQIHDPTQFNRQGPDRGSQYRSAIFFYTPEQEKLAKESKEELEKSGQIQGEIATEIKPATNFYKAEEYHQRYLQKHGQDTCSI